MSKVRKAQSNTRFDPAFKALETEKQIFVYSAYFTLGHFVNNPFSMFSTLGCRYKHHHSQFTHDTKRLRFLGNMAKAT